MSMVRIAEKAAATICALDIYVYLFLLIFIFLPFSTHSLSHLIHYYYLLERERKYNIYINALNWRARDDDDVMMI